jgi:hypothetical protein
MLKRCMSAWLAHAAEAGKLAPIVMQVKEANEI